MTETIVRTSPHSFDETRTRLKDAIARGGAILFAELDQKSAAESVGLSLRPTILLLFGNPRAGTVLMNESPLVALELPLKILVWQDASQVMIACKRPTALAEQYDIAGQSSILNAMEEALMAVLASAL